MRAHERVKLGQEQFPAVEFTTNRGQQQGRLFVRVGVHHVNVCAFPSQGRRGLIAGVDRMPVAWSGVLQ